MRTRNKDGALAVHQLAHHVHEVHHGLVHSASKHARVEVTLAALDLPHKSQT